MQASRTPPARAALMLVAGGIAAVTLVPDADNTSLAEPLCLVCGTTGAADLVLNILLFLPLGAVLARLGAGPAKALVIGVAFAGAIEALQWVIPGRSSTLRDVITNGGGSWAGAVIAWRLRDWTVAGPLAWRRLASALLGLAALVAMLRWLWTVPLPDDGHWALWYPPGTGSVSWPGTILDVRLGTTPVPNGPIPTDGPVQRYLLADSALLLNVRLADSLDHPAPIFGITNILDQYLLRVSQDGNDLLLRVRRVADVVRFNPPEMRYANALQNRGAGETVVIRVHHTMAASPCIRVEERAACGNPPSFGAAWQLLLGPSRRLQPLARLVDAWTLLVLTLPVGLLLRAVRPALAFAAASATLVGLPLWAIGLGYARPGPVETVGLSAGLLLGVAWWTYLHSRPMDDRGPSPSRNDAVAGSAGAGPSRP